jgi:cytoskeletal protein CcmA (bactofilin family)
VTIAPQLGGLSHASGVMVHPNGEIHVEVRAEENKLRGKVSLPRQVTGTLRVNGQNIPIDSGGTATF